MQEDITALQKSLVNSIGMCEPIKEKAHFWRAG